MKNMKNTLSQNAMKKLALLLCLALALVTGGCRQSTTEATSGATTEATTAAVTEALYELPEGVEPVTWEPSSENLIIKSDEARELYDRIKAGDYPSVEELKNSNVVAQIDALSAYYISLYGKTHEIDTDERKQLREKVLKDFLAIGSARTESIDENTGRAKYVYDGPLVKEYQMELVLGLPAAGKSTRVTDPDSEEMKAFILDCDVIKELIPEYQESHGCAADAIHMESMGIMNEAVKALTEGDMKGTNVILPLVSTDLDDLMNNYIKPFEAAGYNVKAKFVPCEENVSMARNVARELETGRIINSAVVFSFGSKPQEVYEKLAGMTNAKGESYKAEEGSTDTGSTKDHSGEIYVLCTSDVHCGVDQGFGYAGLYEIKKSLENQGYAVILVDDGDSIQGEAIGTLTLGEANIELMNAVGYDVCIPGNHEFDYGMDQFLSLAEKAEFTYISCNFNKEGKLVFEPYKIIEAAGKKIAFVGVTTPETLTSSTPSNFQNDKGEFVYGFMQDDNGQGVYDAVQKAVDDARAAGADYVYIMGHMGLEETAKPWTYEDVISHTNGIDVFLDGHSHDTDQVVMKNKDGESVTRCAVGTKMNCIGYSLITDKGIEKTNIWSWPNDVDATTLLGINNPVKELVDKKLDEIATILEEELATSEVDLLDNDPVEKDSMGNPIRMVRRAETNLGDFIADAFRARTGADIGMMNGGGIRSGIDKGKITYKDLLAVFPWSNSVCLIEVTGQEILDALEWGARGVPEENGAFLQVSGLTYEIDVNVESTCTVDEDNMMTGISGARRVKNVMVGDEPIDPEKKYKVAGQNYSFLKHGDGFTCFDNANVLESETGVDNKIVADYIKEDLGGKIGAEYEDPYGQGRIKITE